MLRYWFMKKILAIIVLGLLTGCGGGPGSDGAVLGALIGFIGLIVIAVIMSPIGIAMEKVSKIKSNKGQHFAYIILGILGLIILMTVPSCLGTAMR